MSLIAALLLALVPDALAFTNVTVIPCTVAGSLPGQTIIIRDGRIENIGPSAKVKLGPDIRIINAAGKYMIPGLWDCHVHWYNKSDFELFPLNGVTSVRMMFGSPLHIQWNKEFLAGKALGPRMLVGSRIVDGDPPIWPGSIVARNAEEGVKAVEIALKEKSDFVKVYSVLTREAYFAIAREARRRKIPFEGHAPESVSVSEASNAGQLTMEHLYGIQPECSPDGVAAREVTGDVYAHYRDAEGKAKRFALLRAVQKKLLDTFDPARAEKLYALLRKNKTRQCPTLTVLRTIAYPGADFLTKDPRLEYIPKSVKASWNKTPSPTAELAIRQFQKELSLVGDLYHAGVPILAGTDCLNPYCLPGFGLHDELALLVQAGMSPADALRSATIEPARCFNFPNLGTVERGKIADLILLDANPLEDIRNTTKINSVIVGGKLYDRRALDEGLEKHKGK